MALPNITRDEAFKIAKGVLLRGEKRVEVVRKLMIADARDKEILGKELTQMGNDDGQDGWKLAQWLVYEELNKSEPKPPALDPNVLQGPDKDDDR